MKISQLFIEGLHSVGQIYCDMDGVIVDWERGLYELDSDCYRLNKEDKKANASIIWSKIESAGAEWWANLPWFPGGEDLWGFISQYKPRLLTATPKKHRGIIYDHAHKGKKQWILKNLGQEYVDSAIITIREDKKNYANPQSILIDDDDTNYREWTGAGGIGIKHISCEDTLSWLQRYL